jgi:DNA replication and repair protein RecF
MDDASPLTGEDGPASDAAPVPRVALESLVVQDFRNLERVEVAPPADGLVVVGENGHGKTNLLEAIYYLQLLRSMRGARDQDIVRFGAAGFHVAARLAHPVSGHGEIGVGFARQGKRKRARVDGGEPAKLSDALGALPSVIFSPADVTLVTGAPAERRRYLDVMLALTSRRYLAALQQYRGALARRNAALRDVARTGAGDARVSVWEPALAEHGAVLWEARVAWADRVADEFAARCAAIGELAAVRLRYATALARRGRPTAEVLAEALASQRPHDIRRGVTHAGPHRDDLALTLDARELRLFGSAGQQRTAAIALRMLEAATLRERVGAPPLFLMDDPFAELDVRRSHRILQLLSEGGMGQVVLTVPRAADIPPELTWLERWNVVGGVLRKG